MSEVLHTVVANGFINGVQEIRSNKVEDHQPVYIPVNTVNDGDHCGFCRQFSDSFEESKSNVP